VRINGNMDPVTAVGLVAAAAQLVNNVKSVYFAVFDYFSKVRDAPNQSRELRNELGAMCDIVDDLQDVIKKSRFAASATLKEAIAEFDIKLNEMNERVKISKTKGLNRLKWPFAENENKNYLAMISRYRGIFNTALNIQNT
jgi:hypothetical protein